MAYQMQLTTLLGNHTKHLSELKQAVIRPLLQLAVKAIDQDFIEEGALEIVSENFDVPQEIVDEWYFAILAIVRLHLRSPSLDVKPPEFKQCLQELKLSPECIQDICSVVTGSKRPDLMRNFAKRGQFLPHLVTCKWRVDVIISSSSMSKVMEPTILMEWILSNGERYTFELFIGLFQQLKHAVVKLIFELESLEAYNVIKMYA